MRTTACSARNSPVFTHAKLLRSSLAPALIQPIAGRFNVHRLLHPACLFACGEAFRGGRQWISTVAVSSSSLARVWRRESAAALGFFSACDALAADVRAFKLIATTETRNTCTYCSVACGIIIFGLGDRAENATSAIIHIEGDPDHPINRGTLCRRGRRCWISCMRRPD